MSSGAAFSSLSDVAVPGVGDRTTVPPATMIPPPWPEPPLPPAPPCPPVKPAGRPKDDRARPKTAGAALASYAALPSDRLVLGESGIDQVRFPAATKTPPPDPAPAAPPAPPLPPDAARPGTSTEAGRRFDPDPPKIAVRLPPAAVPGPPAPPLTAGPAHRGIFLQRGSVKVRLPPAR